MDAITKLLVYLGVSFAVICANAYADTKIQKDFGQWRVDCAESDKGAMKCALRLALVNKQNKAMVFGWTIIPGTEEGANKALLQTPTGVLLADGIQVQFPDAEPLTIAYRICGPRYCFAEFDFAQSWLASFSAQKSFSVMFKNGKGQELKYPINLDKFGEAYEYYALQVQKGKQ